MDVPREDPRVIPFLRSRARVTAPVLEGFDPTLLLVLNLTGTVAFGLSGGLAGVRACLDSFGVVVLAAVVAMAGGVMRDVLLGIPPETVRDWRFLAATAAGVATLFAHHLLERLRRPVLVLDAGGLALFCVTGAAKALDHGIGPVPAMMLGAMTGVGGGVLRDVLVREVPVVLRTGLYAVPALIGAAVVAVGFESGARGVTFPILGAAVCLVIRLAALHFDLNLPRPPPGGRFDPE